MRLLDELQKFLHPEHILSKDRSGALADNEIQAATALLLLEAAHGDEEFVWREHRLIVQGLERAFGLARPEVLQLLERSEEIRPPTVRLADVTQVIMDRYDETQRQEIVRLLWAIVDADGVATEWEKVFATHVAQALGISDEAAAQGR